MNKINEMILHIFFRRFGYNIIFLSNIKKMFWHAIFNPNYIMISIKSISIEFVEIQNLIIC